MGKDRLRTVPISCKSCYNAGMRLEKYRDLICPTVIIACLYTVLYIAGIGCPIKFVTGISCLGCGMTRAWLSLLRLDIAAAFHYHPLFALPPVAVVMYLIKARTNIHIYRAIMLTIILSFIMIYFYRLVHADSDVVVFEPGNNILFRLYRAQKLQGAL